MDTAPDRLALLLPWLNDEPTTDADVRRLLLAFLRSFDASEGTGFLRVVGLRAYTSLQALDADKLQRLREGLAGVFRSGFPLDPQPGYEHERTWAVRLRPEPYQLLFGTVRVRDEEPIVKPSRKEKRQREAPGAYELVVSGAVEDLIPYLVMHLLTAPKAVAVGRCPAPSPNNWDARCHRFLLRTTPGHPREFCSEACRVRSHAERVRKAEEAALAARRQQPNRRRKA